MKNPTSAQLTSEEQEILAAYQAGTLVSVGDGSIIRAKYKKIAQAHQAKTQQINLRLATEDLVGLKQRALSAGLPYQTLLTLLIRQFNQGKIEVRV